MGSDEPDVAITWGDLLDLAENAGLTHDAPVFVETSWEVDTRHPVEAGSSSDGQLRLWIDLDPTPIEPGGRDDPNAGTWWHVVPDPDDENAETWMVQIVDGAVHLDGQPIVAHEVGAALLAAAYELDRVLGAEQDGGS